MVRHAGPVNEPLPLAGWRVGVTADRRADAQLDVLRRRGADVLHGCTMKTLDLTRDERLLEVSRGLVAQPPDTLVLETGMGLTMWLEAMDELGVGADLRSVLAGTEVIARGPKATSAARRAGLEVAWSAPNEQFAEIASHVADTGGRRRIALQLDGTDEEVLVAPLAATCDEVVAVPVYRWSLPDDTGPARTLVEATCADELGAVTFTTKQAAVHLVEIAAAMGRRWARSVPPPCGHSACQAWSNRNGPAWWRWSMHLPTTHGRPTQPPDGSGTSNVASSTCVIFAMLGPFGGGDADRNRHHGEPGTGGRKAQASVSCGSGAWGVRGDDSISLGLSRSSVPTPSSGNRRRVTSRRPSTDPIRSL